MHLVVVLEAEVEDETEAQEKAQAVYDVIKQYEFVKMSASVNGTIDIKTE